MNALLLYRSVATKPYEILNTPPPTKYVNLITSRLALAIMLGVTKIYWAILSSLTALMKTGVGLLLYNINNNFWRFIIMKKYLIILLIALLALSCSGTPDPNNTQSNEDVDNFLSDLEQQGSEMTLSEFEENKATYQAIAADSSLVANGKMKDFKIVSSSGNESIDILLIMKLEASANISITTDIENYHLDFTSYAKGVLGDEDKTNLEIMADIYNAKNGKSTGGSVVNSDSKLQIRKTANSTVTYYMYPQNKGDIDITFGTAYFYDGLTDSASNTTVYGGIRIDDYSKVNRINHSSSKFSGAISLTISDTTMLLYGLSTSDLDKITEYPDIQDLAVHAGDNILDNTTTLRKFMQTYYQNNAGTDKFSKRLQGDIIGKTSVNGMYNSNKYNNNFDWVDYRLVAHLDSTKNHKVKYVRVSEVYDDIYGWSGNPWSSGTHTLDVDFQNAYIDVDMHNTKVEPSSTAGYTTIEFAKSAPQSLGNTKGAVIFNEIATDITLNTQALNMIDASRITETAQLKRLKGDLSGTIYLGFQGEAFFADASALKSTSLTQKTYSTANQALIYKGGESGSDANEFVTSSDYSSVYTRKESGYAEAYKNATHQEWAEATYNNYTPTGKTIPSSKLE